MAGRSQLIAWGSAAAAHIVALGLLIFVNFDRRLPPVEPEIIEFAIVTLPEPEPEPVPIPVPRIENRKLSAPPEPATQDVSPPKPKETPRPETSPPSVERQDTQQRVRRTYTTPAPSFPFREVPPPPAQQTLRAIQCARLSPSQRRLCPTDKVEDDFISAMVAEARTAEPVYDPVLNVYRARGILGRLGSGAPQRGMFSTADNATTLLPSATGDSATEGMSTLLNSNPDPVFDGRQ